MKWKTGQSKKLGLNISLYRNHKFRNNGCCMTGDLYNILNRFMEDLLSLTEYLEESIEIKQSWTG